MKSYILLFFVFVSLLSNAQTEGIKLKNALVIGQLDKQEDRYTVEINLTELLTDAGIKAMPSLNVLKFGTDASKLASDSVQKLVAAKGIDTYILVYVRGYDNNFKRSANKDDLPTALGTGNLFPLYRGEISSISFEFLFYRGGVLIGSDIVKCGNVSDRNSVIKRFRKKVAKRIEKRWK